MPTHVDLAFRKEILSAAQCFSTHHGLNSDAVHVPYSCGPNHASQDSSPHQRIMLPSVIYPSRAPLSAFRGLESLLRVSISVADRIPCLWHRREEAEEMAVVCLKNRSLILDWVLKIARVDARSRRGVRLISHKGVLDGNVQRLCYLSAGGGRHECQKLLLDFGLLSAPVSSQKFK
jgi:hypothetical protein